jgi:class 3 adenylate cyclase
LQEEVFVFTNKIAYVVHSIVHSKGGSANKNIGDAFLVSWRLKGDSDDSYTNSETTDEADKALCAVIKIRLALQNDSYFLETIDATAKKRLMEKVGAQNGPVVKVSIVFSFFKLCFAHR